MRKLVLKMSVSIDGFVGGPNGEIDWIFASLREDVVAWEVDALWQAGLHAMGSRSFHDMAAYWPTATEPFAAPMNAIPKIVFSRKGVVEPTRPELTTTALRDATRLREGSGCTAAGEAPADIAAGWAAPQVASDLAGEIDKLKREPGRDILAHGGASFAQSLTRLGLVDEYKLLIHPVALGRGLPLFSPEMKPLDLTLVSTRVFTTGAVAQVYRPA